jgi:hypothetical protein
MRNSLLCWDLPKRKSNQLKPQKLKSNTMAHLQMTQHRTHPKEEQSNVAMASSRSSANPHLATRSVSILTTHVHLHIARDYRTPDVSGTITVLALFR